VRTLAEQRLGREATANAAEAPEAGASARRRPVPHLTEAWFC